MAAPTRRKLLVDPSRRLVRAGLAGLWLFDEGSGTTVRDRSGAGNDLALQAGATWVVGGVSFAVASLQYASSAHTLGETGNTLVAVFRAATLAANRGIAGLQGASTGRFSLRTASASNELAGTVGAQTNSTLKGTTVLTTGVWYMGTLAAGVNTGDPVQLWLGKTSEYVGVQSGTIDTTQGLYVAAVNNNGVSSINWNGSIAAVLSYRGRLNQEQVEQNYRALGRLLAPRGIVLA